VECIIYHLVSSIARGFQVARNWGTSSITLISVLIDGAPYNERTHAIATLAHRR